MKGPLEIDIGVTISHRAAPDPEGLVAAGALEYVAVLVLFNDAIHERVRVDASFPARFFPLG